MGKSIMIANTTQPETVEIRPGVSILSVLQHLRYSPWFALAEFVDNSIQSHKLIGAELADRNGVIPQLRVAIDWEPDGNRIVIMDNAGGIRSEDFPRAFRPAEVPPDRTGLSEYGMGMKSAACWFANQWRVRTSALGDPVIRTVEFHIERIVADTLNELEVTSEPSSADAHFTEIVLEDIHANRHWKTLSKIIEHLTGIYRVFLRDERMQLQFNQKVLKYTEPKVLVAPHFKMQDEPDAPTYEWRKELNFDLGGGQVIRGYAGLLEKGSLSHAGFALFRRDRLIVGSADETYRPREVFGAGNDYRYQRLFGELHLDGFEVTHTKDGFQWHRDEEVAFLDLLKEELKKQPLDLLEQAEGFRSRPRKIDVRKPAEKGSKRTARALEDAAEPVLDAASSSQPDDGPRPKNLADSNLIASNMIELEFHSESWRVTIETSYETGHGDWLQIGEHRAGESGPRELTIRLALSHPFSVRFMGASGASIELLQRIAASMALAEVAATAAGVRGAATVRRNFNELLSVLAKG